MPQNFQLYSLPFLYMEGMYMGWISNSEVAFGVGQCRDSTDSIDMVVGGERYGNLRSNTPLRLDASKRGAGGIDNNTLQANQWYGVYIIADSSGRLPTSGLVSLASNLIPSLPTGYDAYRLRFFIQTDSSGNIIPFYMHGTGTTVTCFWTNNIPVLTNGSATSYTTVNLSTAIPPLTQAIVTLSSLYTPAVAGNQFYIRPSNANATVTTLTTTGSGVVAAKLQAAELTCLAAAAIDTRISNIDYQVTSGDSLSLLVSSFEFYV